MANSTVATPVTQTADEDLLGFLALFEPTEESICEFGDIVLVADDGFHPALKIRVSSCIMAMSSRFFKALFSKKFAEGRDAEHRSSMKPHEVALEDSPASLKLLCLLLHHQMPISREESHTPSAMLDLAVIADKYDCIEALRFPADSMLNSFVTREGPLGGQVWSVESSIEHQCLAAAAYLLDQPTHFRHFTKLLVLETTQIQSKKIVPKYLQILPKALIPSLFNQQNVILQQLAHEISDIMDEVELACQRAINYEEVKNLFRTMRGQGLWPLNSTRAPLAELINSFKQVRLPKLIQRRPPRTPPLYRGSYSGWGSPPRRYRSPSPLQYSEFEAMDHPNQDDVVKAVKKIEDLCVGVCLDCLRERECRIPHKRMGHQPTDDSMGWRHAELSDVYDGGDSLDDEVAMIDLAAFGGGYAAKECGSPDYWEDIW